MAKRRKPQKFKQYRRREAAIRRLGFPTYRDYLASDLWREVRLRALRRDRFACRCCGDRATQVHHRKYEYRVMKGEVLGHLLSLCERCHKSIEFRDDGQKTGTTGAMTRFHRMRREFGVFGSKGGGNSASLIFHGFV